MNQAPHQLDLWSWLCGAPSSVYAVCREGSHRAVSVENDVTIVTEYEDGATGSFISCTHDPLGTDRLEIDCSGGKIVVEDGCRAEIFYFAQDECTWNRTMDYRKLEGMLRQNPDQLYRKEEFCADTVFGREYEAMFSNFAAHILEGEPLIAPGAEGLLSVQLANAAQLSSALRRPLEFPCDMASYDAYLKKRMEEEKIF